MSRSTRWSTPARRTPSSHGCSSETSESPSLGGAGFVLADGTEVERDVGRAWIRLDGQEEYTMVVFGDHALLGAVTLEELLLAPDPSSRRLVPTRGLLMRMAA